MKNKILAVFLLLSMILCSCQVGTNENMETEDPTVDSDVENSQITLSFDEVVTDISLKKEKTIDDFYRELFNEEPHHFNNPSECKNWQDMYKSFAYGINPNGKVYSDSVSDLIYLDADDTPEFIAYNLHNITIYSYESECMNINESYIRAYNEYTGKYIVGCNDEDAIEIRNYNGGEITVECKIGCNTEGQHKIAYIGCFDDDGYEKLCQYFDLENAKYIRRKTGYSDIEMMYMIKTGYDSSFNHKYEIIMDDVDFKEAQKLCYEKGGYLAVITSHAELDRIQKTLEETVPNIDGIALYIGCEGYKDNYNQYWHLSDGTRFRTDAGGGIFVNFPSYIVETYIPDIDEEKENLNYGMLFNCISPLDVEETYYTELMIGPENLVKFDSNMSGKVGYIIEYDE